MDMAMDEFKNCIFKLKTRQEDKESSLQVTKEENVPMQFCY